MKPLKIEREYLTKIKPFQEGYQAGLKGKPSVRCPYPLGSEDYRKWLEGHQRGTDNVWFVGIKPRRIIRLKQEGKNA